MIMIFRDDDGPDFDVYLGRHHLGDDVTHRWTLEMMGADDDA